MAACRRWRLHWIAAFLILVIGLGVAAHGLPWAQAWSALQDARPIWILAALAANAAIFPFWASQWSLLAPVAERPSWPRMFEIVSLVALSLNLLPPLGGQAVALGLLTFRGGLSAGGALSLIVSEQMMTGLGKLSVLAAATILIPVPAWLRGGALSLFAIVAVFSLLLFVIAHGTNRVRPYVSGRPGRIAGLATRVCDWARHLEVLRSGRRTGGGYLYAVAKIGCEVLAALAVQQACGLTVAPQSAVLVVAALSLSTLLRTPGGLGVYEATVFLIYQSLGVPPAPALAAAALQHFVSLVPNLGIGLIVLAIRRPGFALLR